MELAEEGDRSPFNIWKKMLLAWARACGAWPVPGDNYLVVLWERGATPQTVVKFWCSLESYRQWDKMISLKKG